MNSQISRHRRALIVGSLSAALMGAGAGLYFYIGLDAGMSFILGLPLSASLAAFCAIRFIWLPAMRRKETRKRGLWFGVLTGLLALIVTTYIFLWAAGLYESVTQGKTYLFSDIFTFLFGPLMFVPLTFIFGGFLSLPAGAVLGYMFSRNSDPLNTDNP